MKKFLERNFGIELEYNTISGYIDTDTKNKVPQKGSHFAILINKTLKENVVLQGFKKTNNNNYWVVKPDSSCGLEICTPVMNNISDLYKLKKLIDAIQKDDAIKADNRCSFHLHIGVEDLHSHQISSIISNWINFEFVMFCIVQEYRRDNHYCRPISYLADISSDKSYQFEELIEFAGINKYMDLSSFHFLKGTRRTMEIRIGGNEYCKNGESAFNYVLLMLLFFHKCIEHSFKCNPLEGYSIKTSNFKDFFKFMGFFSKLEDWQKNLIKWIISSVDKNASDVNNIKSENNIRQSHFIENILMEEFSKIKKNFGV